MANVSNSSVVRVHKNTDFTIMCNHHLRNQKLSLKAIGLMSKILGLPDDWNYSIAGLVKICKEGETAVRAALHELIDWRSFHRTTPKAEDLSTSITSTRFLTRISLTVWNVRICFSKYRRKSKLKQSKMQLLRILRNKMQKTCILKIRV